jgi:hypothetical protein
VRITILLIISLVVAGCVSHRDPELSQDPLSPPFPSYPPIHDANPQVRQRQKFQVPTQLIITQQEDKIAVSIDMDSIEEIELEVGHKMVTGLRHQLFVVSQGKKKLCSSGLVGGTTDIYTSYINRELGSIPQQYQDCMIEVKFVIFETDIPTQHMWLPEDGKY